MNYYNEIKNKLVDNEIYASVRDYSKERNRVQTYYEVGKLLSEAGSHYGKNVIGEYSKKLQLEVNKKYNRRTLFRMRQFYNAFKDEKVSALLTQLNWSHYLELIALNSNEEIDYYVNLTINNNLSYRELHDRIKSKEYERLSEETKEKLIRSQEINIVDYVKNPIIITNPSNYEIITEKVLKELILDNIPSFLKELGNGFSFIKDEYKIKIGDRYNYIDLLLFNYMYNAFVVVELKVTELKKEHIGQIKTYMNYIDKNLKNVHQDKTIGIIIVRKDNKFIMEYCSDKRIFQTTRLLKPC